MKTKAVRLYGVKDLRLEEFELPAMRQDEIIAEVFTDSLCMSTYKAVIQGSQHAKVPDNIGQYPIIVGHEFCGRILAVGEKWAERYRAGDKFVIQPNIGVKEGYAPGYSYRFVGGNATHVLLQNQIMENGSLLAYRGDTYFEGSLVEPLSCVVGAFNANYHLEKMYSHRHVMGIKQGGNMAILGATGPMGFLAIDLALHGVRKPKRLVVTGRTESKLELARRLYTCEEAEKQGVELYYVNTGQMGDITERLRSVIPGREGFDDVFVFAPDEQLVTQGEQILAYDGCLNFFSGPSDKNFAPRLNFYNIHYKAVHVVGTSGGNTEDMQEAIDLIETRRVHVAKIATHVLGLDDVVRTTLQLPELAGGKKIVYTHKRFSLTPVADGAQAAGVWKRTLQDILAGNQGLWCYEAEQYLMNHAPDI